MTTRRRKTESIENLKRVVSVEDDNVEIVGGMDPVMADAYAESVKNDEHVEEVTAELEKEAEGITPEDPDTGKEIENEFTAKLVLDEDISDFGGVDSAAEKNKPTKVYDDDAFDTYWEMDMFDFIYELVSISDARRKPLDPLGRKHRRFSVMSRDRYVGLTKQQIEDEKKWEQEVIARGGDLSRISQSQIASSGNYIEVYARNPYMFDDIIEICKLYKFATVGPQETYKRKRSEWMPRKDEWITYDYSFRIYVPCDTNGYPMMIDEYFLTLGLTLEDVMNPEFCRQYRKIENKIEAEAKKIADKKDAAAKKKANDEEVAKLVEDAIEGMFNQVFDENSPYYDLPIAGKGKTKEAREFIKLTKDNLIQVLTDKGLEFKRSAIDAAFRAELD